MSGGAAHAYVTLVTNADYAMGAKALCRSIRRTGTRADIVVLHTQAVSAERLAALAAFDVRLIETGLLPLSDAFDERHARRNVHAAAPFTRGASRPFIRRSTISASCASGS